MARLDQSAVVSIFVCPRCGAAIPHVAGFADWCECGYGIAPREPVASAAAGGPRAGLGDRAERRLVTELARPGIALAPPRVPRGVLARALAVHLAWLAPIVAGAAIAAIGAPDLAAIAGGALLAAAGAALRSVRRPVSAGLPADAATAPVLHDLVAATADALGARRPAAVLVDEGAGAALERGGRRGSVLVLGLPLLALLDPAGRVAVVARALAEDVAGDPLRSPVVGGAVAQAERVARRLAAVPPLAAAARRVGDGLRERTIEARRRADYAADVLAARVAGREALLSLIDARHLADGLARIVEARAAERRATGGVLAALRTWAASAPPRELERIHRVERLPASRLDADEPPTGCRVELLQLLPASTPALVLESPRAAALDAELRALEGPIDRRLLDAARLRLRAPGARGPAR